MNSSAQAVLPQDFAARVVAWQRHHGRHGLPWQGTRDAYRIWLSEIMLQQTQVSTVLSYYGRFLERFPTVLELAQASVDEVLALWSGLGYYNRARNLHACAQAVVQRYGGAFPTDAAALESLPGIGRSTAAAVAAFSSGQRVAILDGNVKRVLARHRVFAQDVAKPAGLRALWELAEALLPVQDGIEAYTQGLMDLGATVCTLRRPRCGECPIQADCAGYAVGTPQAFPVKTRRLVRGTRRSVMLMALQYVGVDRLEPVCVHEAQVLMQRRPSAGIWGGLWTLPLLEDDEHLARAVHAAGIGGAGTASAIDNLPTLQHALTHLDWTLQPRQLWVDTQQAKTLVAELERMFGVEPAAPLSTAGSLRWMSLGEALASGLPAPVRLLLEGRARQDSQLTR
jgi:A/G-specific adenine glycosylase